MPPIKLGINGLGRIGRYFLRLALSKNSCPLQVTAVNSPGSISTSAHLIQYDSVHGPFSKEVSAEGCEIKIGRHSIRYSSEKDPSKINWSEVDIVLESSGVFKKKEDLKKHFNHNVKKILTAAPAEGADATLVYGVNHEEYDPGRHHIISNASCTTNCLAPLAYVLDQTFGVIQGYMTTIHAYTGDQRLLDASHKDLRRARSAGLSIIPTTTGAASAIEKILPSLKNKLKGHSVRVPVANVSLVDLAVVCQKSITKEELKKAFHAFEKKSSILKISNKPLVSCDFIGSPYSAVLDEGLTHVNQNTAQVFAWYDNEAGYCHRLMDMVQFIFDQGL